MDKLVYVCKCDLYFDHKEVLRPYSTKRKQKPDYKKDQIIEYDKELNLTDEEYDEYFSRLFPLWKVKELCDIVQNTNFDAAEYEEWFEQNVK